MSRHLGSAESAKKECHVAARNDSCTHSVATPQCPTKYCHAWTTIGHYLFTWLAAPLGEGRFGKHLFTGLAAAWETWGCLEAFTYRAWPPTWEDMRCLAALVYRAWPPDWENIWCLGAVVPICPEFVPCLKWPPWVKLHASLKEFTHSSRWSHIWGVPPLSPFCPRPRVRIRGSLTEFHDLPLSGLTF